jgi:hypothetical protein
VGYVVAREFWIRDRVIVAAGAGKIRFPLPPNPMAVEMKTEWRTKSLAPAGEYVRGVDDQGNDRVLVAFHMMIHAQLDWVWATFIHENFAHLVTDNYATLNDSFGDFHGHPSNPLVQLLHDSHVDILRHYKLIGTQLGLHEPLLLGNPLIEGRKMIQQKQASCISCHRFAASDQKGHLPSGIGGVGGVPPIPGYNSLNFNFTLARRSQCIAGPPACYNQ